VPGVAVVLAALAAVSPARAAEGGKEIRPDGVIMGMEKKEPPPKPAPVEAPAEDQRLPSSKDPGFAEAAWDRAATRHQRGLSCHASDDLDLLVQVGHPLDKRKALAGRAYLACAVQLIRAGDVDQGTKRLDQARALLGNVPDLNRATGPLLRMEADQALAAGDLAGARRKWDEAAATEPDLTDSSKFGSRLLTAAEAAMERDDLAAARTYLDAARAYADTPKAKALARTMDLKESAPLYGWLAAGAGGLFLVVLVVLRLRGRRSGSPG
jgi:hypothetical protein